ncbi:MAG TPA: helix-turn-helix domain-containing protein [Rubrobacter sp.]|jgi:AcrR family transcriptional regulator|nr:helix-turn-helix domain-containing protein [Rubrobacter sp.]
MEKGRTRADRKLETRSALVGAARRLFTERGYAATPTEEIIRGAGASRGALYHHYRDKEELFRAVYEEVDREVVRKIVAAARGQEDAWDRLVVGCRTYLAASLDPAVQQVVLLDGPSVLGWETWREIEGAHCMGLMEGVLRKVADEERLDAPIEPLLHLLFGALSEGALLVARADDREAALAEVEATIVRLLNGLKKEQSR